MMPDDAPANRSTRPYCCQPTAASRTDLRRLDLDQGVPFSRRGLLIVAALLLAAPVALTADCAIARWCLAGHCPRLIRDLLRVCELFGHGLGLLVIVLAIHQLDPARRWALPRVLASALGAGLMANVVKLLVSRARPSGFDLAAGAWASFGGWLPLAGADSSAQSFPSGHVATAAGFAVALVWLYPAGRKVFPVLVVLVACQRMETSSHFLSDVLVAAAVGLLTGMVVLRAPWPTRWLPDRARIRLAAGSLGSPPARKGGLP
ncbi:MAG: hypothetical protein A2W31_12290 [Planctomycetes bacterium RBG_16_64_10]|nr:MAG: hypothetical protein A2W31_12290 [Planctomycetes bacterium RBG_16_64_10]